MTTDEIIEATVDRNPGALAGVHGMYTNILMKKLIANPNNDEIRNVLISRKVDVRHIKRSGSPRRNANRTGNLKVNLNPNGSVIKEL